MHPVSTRPFTVAARVLTRRGWVVLVILSSFYCPVCACRRYYKYPNSYYGSNTDNQQGDFYVRRPSDFHDHILTETCYQ